MPLKTIFGETEYLDGVTISHKEFYEKLIECGTIPTTSQVSPHDFEAKFKEVKEAGDTAVVICLSSLLSGTYQSAHIALDGYEDCITLVDSLNVCLGEQILVLYAVKLRDEGLSAKEIAEKLDITCTLVSESRAPVGSSAKRISGSFTSALAIATRCI